MANTHQNSLAVIRRYFSMKNKPTRKKRTFWILWIQNEAQFSHAELSLHFLIALEIHISLKNYNVLTKECDFRSPDPPRAHCYFHYTDKCKMWRITSSKWNHIPLPVPLLLCSGEPTFKINLKLPTVLGMGNDPKQNLKLGLEGRFFNQLFEIFCLIQINIKLLVGGRELFQYLF